MVELMSFLSIERPAVMLYIEECDTLSFTGVDEHRLPAPLRLYDGRFYAALVSACQGTHPHLIIEITEQVRFGCGRQALKLLDHEGHYEAGHLAREASKWLHAPGSKVSEMKALPAYIARCWKALRLLKQFRSPLPDVMAVSLIRENVCGLDDRQLLADLAAQKTSGDKSADALLHVLQSRATDWRAEQEEKAGKNVIAALGKAGGKGGNALPVTTAAIDTDGDCVYPARCMVPKGTGAIFVKTSVDLGPFCALDCTGRVWAWHGWSADHWPASPTPLLDKCVDCAAGTGFVVAANPSISPSSVSTSTSGLLAPASSKSRCCSDIRRRCSHRC